MSQPSAEPQASAPTPAPTATEIVTRPPPGLARGKWEAPAWAFWVILALVLLSATAYLLRRLGLLKLRGRADQASADATPPSTRTRRP